MTCHVGRTHNPTSVPCISCEMQGAMTCQPALLKLRKVKREQLPCPKEEQEQMALANFLDRTFYDQWFHVPNEGKKTVAYHAKMKRQGLKKGVPDNFIMRPVRGAPGAVIELKRVRGGSTSDEQKKWLGTLQAFGWITYVAKGADDAIRFLREVYGI